MIPLLLAALASLPCVYWTHGVDSRPALEAAGIMRLCVPEAQADTWKSAGFTVIAVSDTDRAARESLPSPGIAPRPGLASPTRSPWIDANGWRFTRHPSSKYVYTPAAGKGALAVAEAYAYGADALLEIDPADVPGVGTMLAFLASLPPGDLPSRADLGVVDDGTPAIGEVMNLLARRNLLFEAVPAPSPRFRVNIALGTADYPAADAADPSAFALKIRRQLTDDQRSLRIYGSEVVICRLTGTAERTRLHVLNYGGRDIEGLRIRLRGTFRTAELFVAGTGRVPLADHLATDDVTEFSIPRLASYAVIDLR